MSEPLKELEGWAAGLLANTSAKELRAMNKKLAMLLRKRQQAHIAANQNPASPHRRQSKPRRHTLRPAPATKAKKKRPH